MINRKHGLLQAKTRGVLAGFAVMFIAAVFSVTLLGCPTESDDTTTPPPNPDKVATPTAAPAGGTTDSPVEVTSGTAITLATTTDDATIYYTTDNTTPTASSTQYSASSKPTITAATTIKAFAVKTDMTDSDVLTAVYTIPNKVATPTADPAGGTADSPVAVESGTAITLATTTTGATIYYTTDGTTPTASSPQYSAASKPTITAATTIKAIAVKSGMTDSDVLEAAYTISWTAEYEVGDEGPGGGKIFYVSEEGFLYSGLTAHNLEAAPADIEGTLKWVSAAVFTSSSIATGTDIGRGPLNTARILSEDSNAPAAKACDEYTNGGKDDWFLPSKDELNKLYEQKTVIGDFNDTGWYWSSSQDRISASGAWVQDFSNGDQSGMSKSYSYRVRPVRAF